MVSGYNDDVGASNVGGEARQTHTQHDTQGALTARSLAWTFLKSLLWSAALVLLVLGIAELVSDDPPPAAESEQR